MFDINNYPISSPAVLDIFKTIKKILDDACVVLGKDIQPVLKCNDNGRELLFDLKFKDYSITKDVHKLDIFQEIFENIQGKQEKHEIFFENDDSLKFFVRPNYYIFNQYFKEDIKEIMSAEATKKIYQANTDKTKNGFIHFIQNDDIENLKNINISNIENNSSLLFHAYHCGSAKTLKFLIDNGANIDGKNNDEMPFIIKCMKDKQSDLVKYIIANRPDVNLNITDKHNDNILMYAVVDSSKATDENLELVKLFLDKNVDIYKKNETDYDDNCAIYSNHLFGKYNSVDIAKLFIEKDEEFVNKYGETAIHRFMYSISKFDKDLNKSLELLQLMIDKGVNVNCKDESNMHLLQYLPLYQESEWAIAIANLLIKNGADTSAIGKDGIPVIYSCFTDICNFASNSVVDNPELLKMFLDGGAKLPDEKYLQEILYSCPNIIKFLIKENMLDTDKIIDNEISTEHHYELFKFAILNNIPELIDIDKLKTDNDIFLSSDSCEYIFKNYHLLDKKVRKAIRCYFEKENDDNNFDKHHISKVFRYVKYEDCEEKEKEKQYVRIIKNMCKINSGKYKNIEWSSNDKPISDFIFNANFSTILSVINIDPELIFNDTKYKELEEKIQENSPEQYQILLTYKEFYLDQAIKSEDKNYDVLTKENYDTSVKMMNDEKLNVDNYFIDM